MVRNYKPDKKRRKWTKTALEAAVNAVKVEGSSKKAAARAYGIPRPTLIRYLQREEEILQLGAFGPVFTPAEELELVNHIIAMESTCYGLTAKDVRSLAYQLAERNQKDHPFSKKTELAGADWLQSFRKRHPELSLRLPEATSAARAQGFNRVSVNSFFEVLEKELATDKFPASRIYNVDETAVVTVQSKRSKILALKGRRQVGCITSADRGILSTACMCVSATGHFLPPMFIFPRTRLTAQLKKGAPADSIFSCNKSGWMTIPDFNIWFNHFLEHTRPSPQSPVLLLLDGHASHVKNLTFIEKARSNNVTVICFPPHCSHKLQPLDVSFMGPLKTNLSQAVENYLKTNPGKVVTLNDISSLVGTAFLKTAMPTTAINGFRKAGIVPLNRFTFNDDDFAPSMVTDVPMDEDSDGPFFGFEDSFEERNSSFQPLPVNMQSEDPSTSVGQIESPQDDTVMDCQNACPSTSGLTTAQTFKVSPDAIYPLPKTTTRKITRNRKRGKTANITASPYRDDLRKDLASKEINELQKERRKKVSGASKAVSETPKRGRGRPKGVKMKKLDLLQDSLCDLCGEVFSASDGGFGWHKCSDCSTWFHGCKETRCPSCH